MSVHLEVETAGVTDRGATGVPPPETRLVGLAVGADCVRSDQHLPVVRLDMKDMKC